MKDSKEFYENLHSDGKDYAAGDYDVARLFRTGCVRKWFKGQAADSLRVLDVGCGKGVFLRDFLARILENEQIAQVAATGIDIVESLGNFFDSIPGGFDFVRQDLDGKVLDPDDNCFDIVVCNHVLEHIFETEQLLCEISRVLKPGGLCIVSLPNLASWANRLLLIFGIQPLGTEVGTKSIAYGFRPAAARRRLQRFTPAGHIRCFTPRALQEIASQAGLKTLGWWNQDRIPLFRITKWSGRGMGIVCTK